MKKLTILAVIVMIFAACADKTIISGRITDATDRMLYLEYNGITATELIDSVRLTEKGSFSFKIPVSRYPDFYRLRIGRETVVLALDSLSARVEVTASAHALSEAEIIGSDASVDIQKLRNSSFRLQRLAGKKMLEETENVLIEHKKLAQQIILSDTHSAASYYAIYQTINGLFYFNPNEKSDLAFWSAVATGYDLYYPDYERTKQLKTTVLQSMRVQRDGGVDADFLLNSSRQEGFIEIALPDRLGDVVKLSSLLGKTVLIDFSAYAVEGATAHTLFLRDLYSRYSADGLEIYQISLDASKLFWLEQTKSVPWICVRDNNSPNSLVLATYNVTELPTFFLMSGEGDIIGRFTHESIEKAVCDLLK